jgi:hypothetical protein
MAPNKVADESMVNPFHNFTEIEFAPPRAASITGYIAICERLMTFDITTTNQVRNIANPSIVEGFQDIRFLLQAFGTPRILQK